MQVDRRGITNSVRNTALAEWMASEEGQEWVALLRTFLHCDEPDAVIRVVNGRPPVADLASARDPPSDQSSGDDGIDDGSGAGDVAVAGRGRGIEVAAVGGRGRGSGGGRGRGPKARPPDATRRAASAQRSSARFELCCRWQWQRRGDRRPRSWPWSSCSRRSRQSRPRRWWFVGLC